MTETIKGLEHHLAFGGTSEDLSWSWKGLPQSVVDHLSQGHFKSHWSPSQRFLHRGKHFARLDVLYFWTSFCQTTSRWCETRTQPSQVSRSSEDHRCCRKWTSTNFSVWPSTSRRRSLRAKAATCRRRWDLNCRVTTVWNVLCLAMWPFLASFDRHLGACLMKLCCSMLSCTWQSYRA